MDEQEHCNTKNLFCPPFSPSRTPEFLDPAALPKPKEFQAWDRVAQPPANPNSRVKVIYKLRPQARPPVIDHEVRDAKRRRLEPCLAVATLLVKECREYDRRKVPDCEKLVDEVEGIKLTEDQGATGEHLRDCKRLVDEVDDDGIPEDRGATGEQLGDESPEGKRIGEEHGETSPVSGAHHGSQISAIGCEEVDPQFAILEKFVARYDANKKAANVTSRASLLNKRDSGKVRLALSSPRQPLADKDGNASPRKDAPAALPQLTVSPPGKASPQKPSTLFFSANGFPTADGSNPSSLPENDKPESSLDCSMAGPPTSGARGIRRSTRERKQSRFLSTASASKTPTKITVGGGSKANGPSLTPEEATMVALTVANTRVNKDNALDARQRLVQIRSENTTNPTATLDAMMDDYTFPSAEAQDQAQKPCKHVHWPENLVQGYQEPPGSRDRVRRPSRLRRRDTAPSPAANAVRAEAKRMAEPVNTDVQSVSKSASISIVPCAPSTLLALSLSLPPPFPAEKPKSRLPRTPRPSRAPRETTTNLPKLVLTPSTASVSASAIATPARRGAREMGTGGETSGVPKRRSPRGRQTPSKRWVARTAAPVKYAA